MTNDVTALSTTLLKSQVKMDGKENIIGTPLKTLLLLLLLIDNNNTNTNTSNIIIGDLDVIVL